MTKNFDVAPDTGQENASANIHLVAGEEEEKEHDKLDPAVFTGNVPVDVELEGAALLALSR
jgi:hypothetical protein